MSTRARIVIDESKCVGAGQCVIAAPEFFDQREDDGIVMLLRDNPSEEELTNVRKAVRLCPAHVISLVDE
jgi:ferredoxin